MEIQIIASGSSGNCYRISDGHTAVLLDAGIPFKAIQRAVGFRTHELSGALITHSHQDHCAAVRDLLRYGIGVYMSEGCKAACAPNLGGITTVKPLVRFYIGTFIVLPFDVE